MTSFMHRIRKAQKAPTFDENPFEQWEVLLAEYSRFSGVKALGGKMIVSVIIRDHSYVA